MSEARHVTAAVTGPATLVVQLPGRNLSILHGELMGHILGLVLRKAPNRPNSIPCLYSDHQNSVDLIDELRTQTSQDSRLRRMNGRAYYRWILAVELLRERDAVLTYTRGHSAELTLPAQMNREADHYASGSQRVLDLVPVAPSPTFTMDDYTFHGSSDGWIESNIWSFVDHFLANQAAAELARGNRMRMLTCVHDLTAPPEYPYTRAGSAHSAVIQLYARSGQLPTAVTLGARGKLGSPLCRLGCRAVESMHHVFVVCPHFSAWRIAAAEEIVVRTERKLVEAGIIAEAGQTPILRAAKSLFIDDADTWPLKMSQYYIGQIPRIQDHLAPDVLPDPIKRRRLLHYLSMDWHTGAIRLAGRIFGSIQRTMAAHAAGLNPPPTS